MRFEEPGFLTGYLGKEGSESASLGIVDTVTGLILEKISPSALGIHWKD